MFTINVAVALGIPLLAHGIYGWDLPIQISNPIIVYPFSFLQATLINLGVIYLVMLAMVGFTLLLSSRLKSPFAVLLVIVPTVFIPLFLVPTGTTGLYNLILLLLPYRATIPRFGSFISYQFGALVLDVFNMRAIVYVVLTIIAIPFAYMGFKKHQVS